MGEQRIRLIKNQIQASTELQGGAGRAGQATAENRQSSVDLSVLQKSSSTKPAITQASRPNLKQQ